MKLLDLILLGSSYSSLTLLLTLVLIQLVFLTVPERYTAVTCLDSLLFIWWSFFKYCFLNCSSVKYLCLLRRILAASLKFLTLVSFRLCSPCAVISPCISSPNKAAYEVEHLSLPLKPHVIIISNLLNASLWFLGDKSFNT